MIADRAYKAVSFLAARVKNHLRLCGAHRPQSDASTGAPGVPAAGRAHRTLSWRVPQQTYANRTCALIPPESALRLYQRCQVRAESVLPSIDPMELRQGQMHPAQFEFLLSW